MVTSSAVVGSSAISSAGSQASAMAIITRWRMPPDRRCGKSSMRVGGRGDAHQLEHLDGARLAPPAATSAVWARIASTICWPTVWTGLSEVIGSWKIIDILPPRSLRRSSAESAEQVAALEQHGLAPRPCRAGSRTRPMTESEVTLLPQPGFADQPDRLAAGDGEVDAVDRAEQAAVGVEMGPQTADLEQRCSIRTSSPGPCRRCSDRACAAARPSASWCW